MDDPQRERLGLLLEQALALTPEERPRFLEDACSGDASLRDELTSLLVASELSSGFFEKFGEQVVLPTLTAAADIGSHAVGVGEVVSHYEIVERIGGGMGVVYKARDTRLGRWVALKFLAPGLVADEVARGRLYAEARAASTLDHPNIGVVHEIAEAEPGGLFIAFGWYEGETLKEILERGPLSLADALATARQIAAALAVAHQAGIIHRDVKPSNIIRTPQGVVKLVDFGIAKLPATDLTREGTTLGTIAYMSPEQTRGLAVDPRTDVWSLGVVLYEMLTGRRPFRGESDETVIHAIRHDEPEPIEHLRPDIPAVVSTIVRTCLAKAPSRRYAKDEDLLAELQALDDALPGGVRIRLGPRRRSRSARLSALFLTRPVRVLAVLAIAGLIALGAYAVRSSRVRTEHASSGTIAGRDRPALAVLPFENRSGRPEDQYFTDGLHDEIRSRLSGVATLRVSSRTSVMQYRDAPKQVRQIGKELGVDAVLEGAVQRAGDSVRVFVQLIDARNDAPLWSRSYDRGLDMAGLLTIQREIATSVAEALRAELTDAERARVARVPTMDVEAYRHYLLGRHHWNQRNPDGMDSALAHFEAALRRDPLYARAYAGVADVHVLGYGPAGYDGFPLAIAAARKALRLDPDLAEAHSSLGLALTLYAWDWPAAEREFRRAIELDPNYATAHQWYSEYLATQGRLDEAVAEVRLAESLDPLSLIIGWNVARILGLARRYEEAVAQLHALDRLHPGQGRIIGLLAMHLMALGRNAEAADVTQAQAATLTAQEPGFSARLARLADEIGAGRTQAMLAFLEEGSGSRSGEGHVRMFGVARVAAGGDADSAMRMLEKIHEERRFGLTLPDLAVGALVDLLRDDPRFQNLLRRMRLDPQPGIQLRARDPGWLWRR